MYSDGVNNARTRGRGVTPHLSDRQKVDTTRFLINLYYDSYQILIS